MPRLRSAMSSVAVAMAASGRSARAVVLPDSVAQFRLADDGRASFAAEYRRDRSRFADREHDDRHTVFPGKREGRGIHHFEGALDGLLMGEALEALRLRVLHRIGAVDPVDFGALEHGLGPDFARAQDRRGVGGEKRIAGAGNPFFTT